MKRLVLIALLALAATALVPAPAAASPGIRYGIHDDAWIAYGPGTLVEVNEHHTVIEFDEHGRRTFSTKLVTLQSTNEPAPHKAPRKRAVKAKTAKPKEAKEAKEKKEK